MVKRVRVIVADDSLVARKLLRGFLENTATMEVVGEAANGRQAVELARALKPDLITMDLDMPVMTGMDAIDEIMTTKAIPILVVSNVTDPGAIEEAIRRGALEVVSKPEYQAGRGAEFVAKVRLLAGVPVITRLRSSRTPASQPAAVPADERPAPAALRVPQGRRAASCAIAIASSTGGPQALAHILAGLPAGFCCPVFVAQHMSDGFAQGMADWLSGLCSLPVRLGEADAPIEPGVVYLSPSERHMVVTPSHHIALRERVSGDVYRPSCDALLESVARVFGARALGVILTGMGRDGVRGMAAIRAAGGVTIAQDEASSVIFGMNRLAIEQGGASQVLALDRIVDALVNVASGRRP